MHYEEGQVLLQSGTGLTHALKRWASVIAKWDKFNAYIMHQKKKKKKERKCMHYEECQVLLQSGTALIKCIHYEECQVLLQSGTALIKCYYKVGRFDTCIIKKVKCYCKVGQV